MNYEVIRVSENNVSDLVTAIKDHIHDMQNDMQYDYTLIQIDYFYMVEDVSETPTAIMIFKKVGL